MKSKTYIGLTWLILALFLFCAGYGLRAAGDDRLPPTWRVAFAVFSLVFLFFAYLEAGRLGFKFIRVIQQNDMLPRLYGVAWLCINKPYAYCAPVPFNMLIGMSYNAWCWLRHGWRQTPMSPHVAYHQGRKDAYMEILEHAGDEDWFKRVVNYDKT